LIRVTTAESSIEDYLRKQRRWVPARELMERFGVPERALRAVGDQPGLCTRIAISSKHGFKHIAVATDAEFKHFYRAGRKHAIGEMVRLRDMQRRRSRMLKKASPPMTRDGQFLLEAHPTSEFQKSDMAGGSF